MLYARLGPAAWCAVCVLASSCVFDRHRAPHIRLRASVITKRYKRRFCLQYQGAHYSGSDAEKYSDMTDWRRFGSARLL